MKQIDGGRRWQSPHLVPHLERWEPRAAVLAQDQWHVLHDYNLNAEAWRWEIQTSLHRQMLSGSVSPQKLGRSKNRGQQHFKP